MITDSPSTQNEALGRTCVRCRKFVPLVLLRPNKPSKYGRMRWCMDCFKSYQKSYSKLQRSRIRFGNNRVQVLKRDRYRCVICGMTNTKHKNLWHRSITVDHIDGNGRYSKKQNNNTSNLQTLCLSCHGKKDKTLALLEGAN